MMDEGLILLTFAGMGAVTYIPRWLPLHCLAEKKLPAWFESWLDFIPASILSALLLPSLITGGHPRSLDLTRPELIVAVPTFLFAVKTKSLGGTVLVGMALFWLAGRFFG
ncbi:MAG TPA: AzlD domain-containing protein [Syntrophales bacterium]|jgi:branched-subunit amino acid transport protein|nr:AzlD domain-containing protein [Syntrophales bacterium]HOD97506.1 AzlD domain-containing protein [Syntrophales bacterium]HOH72246.1 AzlD domain-containing protein [Syntrophales bacterium]HPX81160.1 AzlD domain-containing protein [Syntrophales bacterium]HQB13396.1 AzlD domain-containing protein [Syntrophales bacterium]